MSSDVIFLQAKWSKIKERVEGWKSGKKMWFKRITVCSYEYSVHVFLLLISSTLIWTGVAIQGPLVTFKGDIEKYPTVRKLRLFTKEGFRVQNI